MKRFIVNIGTLNQGPNWFEKQKKIITEQFKITDETKECLVFIECPGKNCSDVFVIAV